MRKEILRMFVENIGWINRFEQVERKNKQPLETKWITLEHPIEVFEVKGEMAMVNWYRQENREFNGKFVVEIEYYQPTLTNLSGDNQ